MIQTKLTFVLVLCMRLFLESCAASDICSICSCIGYTDCSSRGLNSVPHPIPPNVESLVLWKNNIKEIKVGTFENLPNLKHIILDENDIEEIKAETFRNIPSLVELTLSSNRLNEIKPETFRNIPSLENLILNSNRLNEIKAETFRYLSNLRILRLDSNYIREIKSETFQYLPNLIYLFLNSNHLKEIKPETFRNSSSLTHLYLQNNNIEKIEENSFQHLPSLYELDLSSNRIQNYEDGAFLFLPSINSIDLRNNSKIMCGCHLPALVKYMKSTYNRTVDVKGKCQTDSSNNQNKVIPILEYSRCKHYSLFPRNLQCQTCSGAICQDSEVTNCGGDESVCRIKFSVNGIKPKFERSCSTYRKCVDAMKRNPFTCKKWSNGSSCVACCVGNLCNKNDFIGWSNSFVFKLTFISKMKKFNEYKILSTAMARELSNLKGAFEVEYCGVKEDPEIFTITCIVPDTMTKEQASKQILETLKTSQILHDFGFLRRNMKLIDAMVCDESSTKTSSGTFYWPLTKIGTNATIPCHANVATRYCSAKPADVTSPKCSLLTSVWQEPDMSQCYNTQGITRQLKNITSEKIDKENIEKVSKKLLNISKKSVYFKEESFNLAVDILEKMVPLISNVSANITVNNILHSINNIINTPEEVLIKAEQSGKRILDIIEAIADKIPLEEQQLTVLYSNLGIGVMKVDVDTFNGAFYGVSFGNNETEAKTMIYNHPYSKVMVDFISLPKQLFERLEDEEKKHISRITFFSIQDKLYRVIKKSITEANTKINSLIIAATILNIRITNLHEPVNISFNAIDKIATYSQCAYWDESPGEEPHWSTEGCITLEHVPGGRVRCSCNHLTSFALQMKEENTIVIHLLPYIGCGLSMVFLIVTVIIHIGFKNLRKSMSSKILICLCICLAVSNFIFLVGMQPYATRVTAACKAVAALIHYFLITALMWMTVEVGHVCQSVVVISETVQASFMIWISILAWGFPAVIVIITLAINKTNNYIRIEQVCWLSKDPFYAGFLAPVLIVLIVNIFIFSLDVWHIMSMKAKQKFEHERNEMRILGIACVFLLFSVTWISAFYSFDQTNKVFTLMFPICNTLLGMFIFFLYCICTKDTRDVICKCVLK